MDYEKAYKEALESAKGIINYYKEHNRCDESAIEDLEIIFPELKESEDKRIKKELTKFLKNASGGFLDTTIQCKTFGKWAAWLEKQGEQPSAIRWYDVSLIPQELEELLVEWDSEDATWHEIAFYHADTKTFWDGTRQVENVTRWCYIIDLLEKQGEKKAIMNVPTREVILSIWDLGNEWKELTNGSISTEYGTQLDYIQKHWHESEYYLREK